MNTHILELKRKYVEALGHVALQYLENGMVLFHSHLRSESFSSQAAFGNLALALEFILKCFIAEKNPGVVFRDMPPEARAVFSAPERIPEFFRWRGAPIDLGSSAFRMIDLGECISCYYTFLPQMKQLLLPHLEFVAHHRDAALHAILPSLAPSEFERAGYAVLQLVQSLEQDPAFRHIAYKTSEQDQRFVERFVLKRAERVSLALEQARLARNLTAPEQNRKESGWNTSAASCPVCRADGSLQGYTELSMGQDEEGPAPTLDFFAVSFACPRCGLALHDFDELKLAGLPTLYDRSEELEARFAEYGSFSGWEME